jgi:signal transduction histidine kinase
MLLITGSFYFYAQLNLKIISDQNRERARLLVTPRLLAEHSQDAVREDAYKPMFRETPTAEAGEELHEVYRFDLFSAVQSGDETGAVPAEADVRPSDQAGHEALNRLRKMHQAGEEPLEIVRIVRETAAGDQYRFYKGLIATESCVHCHYHRQQIPDLAVGDLIGVAVVQFPLAHTTRPLRRNNAILIAMALVTASLAMVAAYAIVRYVIVKPLLHLQEVSDAIAHGELDQRADIRTGDEFEEVSHAYNRMLRHLVTIQDELRQVNSDLDRKVDELAQANLSLHEMNKIKSEFLATMSHELRTPLNSILGFSDVLAGADNVTEKQRKFLKNIETSGQHLLTLINDILDLAKIESGKMELHLIEFSVEELVERLVGSIRPLAERKNIELKWEVDKELPIAHQDAGKLQQILNNLLSNAVKFTPEGGRVHVQGIWEREEWLVLVVADTGIGIPLDDQATIFEKFRQGTVASGDDLDPLTREFEGTGLGLSIVKELSRLLGGEVHLESEFGKGSTLTVRVPLHLQPTLELSDERRDQQTVEFHRAMSSEPVVTSREAD